MSSFVIRTNKSPLKEHLAKIKSWAYKDYQYEQIAFRFFVCQNCLEQKKCNKCSCNPLDKLVEVVSCNPSLFPNMMSKKNWEDFKKTNNIEIS